MPCCTLQPQEFGKVFVQETSVALRVEKVRLVDDADPNVRAHVSHSIYCRKDTQTVPKITALVHVAVCKCLSIALSPQKGEVIYLLQSSAHNELR